MMIRYFQRVNGMLVPDISGIPFTYLNGFDVPVSTLYAYAINEALQADGVKVLDRTGTERNFMLTKGRRPCSLNTEKSRDGEPLKLALNGFIRRHIAFGLCVLLAVLSLIVLRVKGKRSHSLNTQSPNCAEPPKLMSSNLDIQEVDETDPLDKEPIDEGEVSTWIHKSTEITRRNITYGLLGLYALGIVLGLIVSLVTGSDLLLVKISSVLELPLGFVAGYYFHVSEGPPSKPRK